MVTHDPDGEEVAARGFDPNRIDLEALEQAELMLTNDEIRPSELRATAERLTRERVAYLIAYQDYLDAMDRDYERETSPPSSSASASPPSRKRP